MHDYVRRNDAVIVEGPGKAKGSYPFFKAVLRVPSLFVKGLFTGSYPVLKAFLRVPIL